MQDEVFPLNLALKADRSELDHVEPNQVHYHLIMWDVCCPECRVVIPCHHFKKS